MRDKYELRLNDELIAELRIIDAEFPWMWFEIFPTAEFSKIRSLFAARERYFRSYDRVRKKVLGGKRASAIWQKILNRGVIFVDANTGERAEWFFLRLHGNELDARFVFRSRTEREEKERDDLREEYKHLFE